MLILLISILITAPGLGFVVGHMTYSILTGDDWTAAWMAGVATTTIFFWAAVLTRIGKV